MSILCLFINCEQIRYCFGVSIVDFEQVHASWELLEKIIFFLKLNSYLQYSTPDYISIFINNTLKFVIKTTSNRIQVFQLYFKMRISSVGVKFFPSMFPFDALENIRKPNFYFPWNHQRTSGFLMISGGDKVRFSDVFRGIKREPWENKC